MSLSEPIATVIAALPLAGGTVLAWRTRTAKRGASEKLVAKITERIEQNYREQIATSERQHREQVEWLQGQILYYQKMSAPKLRQRPDHPPGPQ